jgi:hypothetical protein
MIPHDDQFFLNFDTEQNLTISDTIYVLRYLIVSFNEQSIPFLHIFVFSGTLL